MASRPDPRRVARLTIPARLRDGDLAHYPLHILDLSPLGVRIAHPELWSKGVVCAVELPPALGALRLPGRVVWTRLRAGEDILEGHRRSRYESGVEFTSLTSEQQATLALALATFRATQAGLDRKPSA
jgi:PilZ domain